jgi:hypothetical protein
MSRLVLALLVPAVVAVLAACGAPSAPTPDPDRGVIVTIRVVDEEEFRVLLTEPEDIDIARRLLAGEEAPGIPNGKVIRTGDGGVNTGYSWHLDPDDFEWADMTIEVCDGRPSDVESVITSDRYCTWAAKVVAVEPAG